jgi:hypothetical protein
MRPAGFNKYSQAPHPDSFFSRPMKRWIGAGLLASLAIAGVAAARHAEPGADESSPAGWQSPPLPHAQIGTTAQQIGLIGDAALGNAGESFLLDVLEHRVGVARAEGAVTWTGRDGHGPGELSIPVALAADAGVLYVLDRGNQRIERYRTTGGELRRSGDGVPLEFIPEDLCVSHGRLFVLGAHRGHAIHEISPEGRVLRSFAPDAQLADDLLATFRAGGYLACGTDGEIDFLPLLRPEVHRFSAATGALLQSAALPGYNAVRVRRTADGVEFIGEGGSHDVGASLVPLSGGRLLVQVGGTLPGATTQYEFTSVRSYVVDWGHGAVHTLPGTLPRITDVRDGWALAVETDPEPAFRRIRFPPPLGTS